MAFMTEDEQVEDLMVNYTNLSAARVKESFAEYSAQVVAYRPAVNVATVSQWAINA